MGEAQSLMPIATGSTFRRRGETIGNIHVEPPFGLSAANVLGTEHGMNQEEYRARADECEAQAKQTSDKAVKQVYEDLARQWRELADQVERYGLRR